MKEFTREMLDKLTAANESKKGSHDYYKYFMECDGKIEKGRWFFMGHSIPYQTGTFKTYRDNTYIITEDSTGLNRYRLTDDVKELLGI